MTERFMVLVSKSRGCNSSAGSNPVPAPTQYKKTVHECNGFDFGLQNS